MALFDSSREDDDEDEDYSLNEDIIQNSKKYKYDEDYLVKNPIVVPKGELKGLIADQRKAIDETHPGLIGVAANTPV